LHSRSTSAGRSSSESPFPPGKKPGSQEDGTLKAQAALDIDRTLWNVCYGSGRLYERLGMHLVNDLISIELFIVAREAA
jgi:hypothetical protein